MNLQNQIEYLREYDLGDMFDECSVPSGLDMERVRGAIVMRCGLMTPLFSEPLTQRAATQQFFFENQWNFEHVLNVLRAEYSPIENVAEVREETTTSKGTDSLTIDRDASEHHSGSDQRVIEEQGSSQSQESGTTQTTESGTTGTQETETTTTQESGTTRTERKISAENISTYSPDNEETVTHGRGEEVSREAESTITHGKGETITHGKGEEASDNKNTDDTFTHGHVIQSSGYDVHSGSKNSETTFSVNRHGNIGVTTNQDMINQELDLLIRFNAYRFIADLYEKELILGIY